MDVPRLCMTIFERGRFLVVYYTLVAYYSSIADKESAKGSTCFFGAGEGGKKTDKLETGTLFVSLSALPFVLGSPQRTPLVQEFEVSFYADAKHGISYQNLTIFWPYRSRTVTHATTMRTKSESSNFVENWRKKILIFFYSFFSFFSGLLTSELLP